MSKYEEALRKVTISHELYSYRTNEFVNRNHEDYLVCINPEWEKELNLLQELVERATPKKPDVILHKEKSGDNWTEYYCPSCGEVVNEKECCSYNECRQKLEWSK